METKTRNLKEIAEQIDAHQVAGTEMDKITINHPSLTVEDAYEIQKLCIDQAESRGDNIVGWKMGLTSKAKQESVGVSDPIYGRLTKPMELTEPVLSLEGLIHPRVEPEIAFVMNKELKGDSLTPRDIWMATEFIVPAVEVIDSRYRNFSFTLVDVVADNASSSKFLLGNQAYSPFHTSLSEVDVKMTQNGEEVQKGTGAAVLGHPVKSIVELTRMINKEGLSIKPGMVILTGGITEAVNVFKGDKIDVDFGPLGKLNFDVKG